MWFDRIDIRIDALKKQIWGVVWNESQTCRAMYNNWTFGCVVFICQMHQFQERSGNSWNSMIRPFCVVQMPNCSLFSTWRFLDAQISVYDLFCHFLITNLLFGLFWKILFFKKIKHKNQVCSISKCYLIIVSIFVWFLFKFFWFFTSL